MIFRHGISFLFIHKVSFQNLLSSSHVYVFISVVMLLCDLAGEMAIAPPPHAPPAPAASSVSVRLLPDIVAEPELGTPPPPTPAQPWWCGPWKSTRKPLFDTQLRDSASLSSIWRACNESKGGKLTPCPTRYNFYVRVHTDKHGHSESAIDVDQFVGCASSPTHLHSMIRQRITHCIMLLL